jgi:hypothetical protein
MRTALALLLCSCVGTTGSDLVTFRAAAAGHPQARAPFATPGGIVTLTKAKLHVGALYLNRSLPISGSQERACILPGIYVGQVLAGRDIDLLDPGPQPFPVEGNGTADRALTGEVWLTGTDLNDAKDAPVILEASGTVERNGQSTAFEARITIGTNRLETETDPARPGANPICKQRIVSPIAVSLVPRSSGALLLRVDPRAFFVNVAWGDLEKVGDVLVFADRTEGASNVGLYRALLSTGPYSFEWRDP